MSNNQEISAPLLIQDLGMQFATEKSKHKVRFGIYRCKCGNEFKAVAGNVKRRISTSCGCYQKEIASELLTTHGMTGTKIHEVWRGMKKRCFNKNNPSYFRYGGRGITVCERWLTFENFRDDMLPTYQYGLSIDRINNDGNYEPSNCRWATKLIQSRNTKLLMSRNISGFRGVYHRKHNNRYESSISVDSKRVHIGNFNNAKEAAIAYDTFVIVYGLEHTTNFPKGIFETTLKGNS